MSHDAALSPEPPRASPRMPTVPPHLQRRLPLGLLKATPSALTRLQEAGINPVCLLQRHHQGDWGDVSEEDWRGNDDHLLHGGRILSNYRINHHDSIWIITAADRSVTTIRLPIDS